MANEIRNQEDADEQEELEQEQHAASHGEFRDEQVF